MGSTLLYLPKYNRKRVAKGLQPENWPPYYVKVILNNGREALYNYARAAKYVLLGKAKYKQEDVFE